MYYPLKATVLDVAKTMGDGEKTNLVHELKEILRILEPPVRLEKVPTLGDWDEITEVHFQ